MSATIENATVTTGAALPGVTTGDNGAKGGLAGVDNGTLRFDQVRVPRRMLLDRYGGIDDSGTYSSPIESAQRRFFTMLGTLVRGRICVAGGAGVAARRALSIATRYGVQRRQFAAPGREGEVVGVVINCDTILYCALLVGMVRAGLVVSDETALAPELRI